MIYTVTYSYLLLYLIVYSYTLGVQYWVHAALFAFQSFLLFKAACLSRFVFSWEFRYVQNSLTFLDFSRILLASIFDLVYH